MCGFSGVLKINNQTVVDIEETALLMSNALIHRGPDDKGIWIDREKKIALAHQRLAILDTSDAGHQPMTSKCGRYTMVFNGEIYNHKIIRQELDNNYKFKEEFSWDGQSDTETILASISIWGFTKTLEKIVGMFAIACWDLDTKTLFLSRDRIGEKPLFYGYKNNLLYFASELKSFKKVKEFPLEVNKKIIPLYLSRSFIPAPFSIYKNIHKLPPGTYLAINSNEIDMNSELSPIRYWDLTKNLINGQKNKLKISDKELVKFIDDFLKNSIQKQMIADVPIGAFLSGGVDSSIVVSIMQAISSERIKTYTLGFDDFEYDESKYAKKVADFLGTDHKELILKPSDAINIINKLSDIYDEPFADVSQIPMVLISEFASKDVKVCLSGDGGDELFGGYNRYIFAANSWKVIKFFPLKIRKLLSKIILSLPIKTLNKILMIPSLFLPRRIKFKQLDQKINKFAHLLTAKDSSEIYNKIFLQNDLLKNILKCTGNQNLDYYNDLGENKSLDSVHNMILQDMHFYLPDDVLVKLDRASMYSSLETRLPMLDHRLIDYTFRISTNKKIRFFKGKWILRKLLNKYLPKVLYERPKAGFSVPIGDWLRGPLRKWANELLSKKNLEKGGYFNSLFIREKWEEHLSMKKDWSNLLWGILMFQIWLNK